MPGKYEAPKGKKPNLPDPGPRKKQPGKYEAPRGKKPNLPNPGPRKKQPVKNDVPRKKAAPAAPVIRIAQTGKAAKAAPAPRMPIAPKPKKTFPWLALILGILAALLLTGVIFVGLKLKALTQRTEAIPTTPQGEIYLEMPTEEATEPETTEPVPEHVVSTATIGAMGDILMHLPVISSGRKGDGTYDFSSIFQYLAPTIGKYDYSVANLETTLAGTAKPYSGYPNFNCPDEIVTAAQSAGFDMLLTANNHCFDTGMDGYLRTLEVTREAGMDTIGTMTSGEDPKYMIKDISGIRIGMICYTYETTNGQGERPALNGLPMYGGSYDMINTFVPTAPEPMYDEIRDYMLEMKEQGVDATMLFIHWGTEYVLKTDKTQPIIAQGLANLGLDVIVGGHPHVVEPMALLQSEVDPDHKTICIYSLGNAVSNQRQGYLSQISTAHTEDGGLFTVTFEKYSDGTTYVAAVNLIPTWVNMRTQGAKAYNILPLDGEKRDAWQAAFDLTDLMLSTCDKSYKRTMDIVGEGLAACQEYLSDQKEARDQYYYDLAWHPEKFVNTAPVEVITAEVVTEQIPDAA